MFATWQLTSVEQYENYKFSCSLSLDQRMWWDLGRYYTLQFVWLGKSSCTYDNLVNQLITVVTYLFGWLFIYLLFADSPADLHGMWYPTVRRTLVCLSRLYRCVDRPIFQGLSQEALTMCIQSVASAAQAISNKKVGTGLWKWRDLADKLGVGLLAPCSRALLERFIATQLVKAFPACEGLSASQKLDIVPCPEPFQILTTYLSKLFWCYSPMYTQFICMDSPTSR